MKDDEDGKTEFGIMAQEIEEIFPELVRTADDEMGTKSVNYVGLIAPMIEATKELSAENAALKAELASIKSDHAEFKSDIMKEVNGLKLHTGYGMSKAQIGLWMVLGMGGSAILFLAFNGFTRGRLNKEE